MSRETEPAPQAVPDPDQPSLPTPHKTWVTVAVMAAMIMQLLDTTIANVALPHIQTALGATQDQTSWILTSYILASAVALPLSGWLVDRLGLKNLMLISVAMFVGASMLCGMATSLPALVFFRVLQGLGGAFLSPLAQAIMLAINPAKDRPKAMALFIQGVMIGPIVGPVIGGYLTEGASWRWVFYVNVPIGLAALAMLFFLMPATKPRPRPFDLFGWLMIAIALASLQLMLDRGPGEDWFTSGEIVTYAVALACAIWIFVVHSIGNERAIFPLPIFADRNVTTGAAFMFLIGLVMFSVMALLPVMLQTIYSYDAVMAGWLLTPRGVGMLASTALTRPLHGKLDPRILIGGGMSIVALSLYLMTGWSPDMPMRPIIISGVLQGLGIGMVFVPLNVLTFATIQSRFQSDVAALVNLTRNLGSSVGIAVVTVLLTRNLQINHAELAIHFTRFALPFDGDQLARFGVAEAALRVLDGLVNKQAAMIAYLDDYYLMTVACFAAVPLVALLKKGKVAGKPSADAAAAGAH